MYLVKSLLITEADIAAAAWQLYGNRRDEAATT